MPHHAAREFGLPTQTGIEGEAAGDAPIILCIEGHILGARGNLVGDLHAGGVDLSLTGNWPAQLPVPVTPGSAVISWLMVKVRPSRDREFRRWRRCAVRRRTSRHALRDTRLPNRESGDRESASAGGRRRSRCRAWRNRDGEGGEGGITDAGEADLGRQVFAAARTGIDELAAQVGDAQFVGEVGAEDVSVRANRLCTRTSVRSPVGSEAGMPYVPLLLVLELLR